MFTSPLVPALVTREADGLVDLDEHLAGHLLERLGGHLVAQLNPELGGHSCTGRAEESEQHDAAHLVTVDVPSAKVRRSRSEPGLLDVQHSDIRGNRDGERDEPAEAGREARGPDDALMGPRQPLDRPLGRPVMVQVLFRDIAGSRHGAEAVHADVDDLLDECLACRLGVHDASWSFLISNAGRLSTISMVSRLTVTMRASRSMM